MSFISSQSMLWQCSVLAYFPYTVCHILFYGESHQILECVFGPVKLSEYFQFQYYRFFGFFSVTFLVYKLICLRAGYMKALNNYTSYFKSRWCHHKRVSESYWYPQERFSENCWCRHLPL
jgi:hypothetical protein